MRSNVRHNVEEIGVQVKAVLFQELLLAPVGVISHRDNAGGGSRAKQLSGFFQQHAQSLIIFLHRIV